MDEFNVIARIKQLCDARSWSYYRLAKASDIPYSTLNTMLRKSYIPTVPSLQKICDGFGITLAQFFSERDEIALLTRDQKDCLTQWDRLDEEGKELALAYMQGMADYQKTKS